MSLSGIILSRHYTNYFYFKKSNNPWKAENTFTVILNPLQDSIWLQLKRKSQTTNSYLPELQTKRDPDVSHLRVFVLQKQNKNF